MWWHKSSSKQQLPKLSTAPTTPRSKPLMMLLEPRFMFDGAVAATHAETIHAASDHSFSFDHVRTITIAPTAPIRSVVFVDASVPNYQELISGLPAGTPYVVLNTNSNGLAQILQYVEANPGIDNIHLISHGTEGAVQAGSVWLNSGDLSEYSAQLAAIGQHMAPGGDLLLYGCDVAEGTTGQTFVQQLAAATHLNVAANTIATGSPSLGGSWTLDYEVGKVNTGIILSTAVEQQYGQLLGLTTEDYTTNPSYDSGNVTSFTLDGLTYTIAGAGGPWDNVVSQDPSLQSLADESGVDNALYFDLNGLGGISSITITKSGGGAFDMYSLDFDGIANANLTIEANGNSTGAVSATSNGSYVTQTFLLGGSGNSTTAAAFEDATSVVISGGNLLTNLGHLVYGPAILPAASVSSVTAVTANGTYHIGQTLDFDVNFSGNVTVTGTPELPITLTTGGTVDAHYVSGSGTSTLEFAYTIVSGEQAASGITLGSALTLNGGTIVDSGSNNATLTLNNVASMSGIDVQAIQPTVSSDGPSGGSPNTGGSESFTVVFSKPVTTPLSSDFNITTTGNVTDSGITNITTTDNQTFTVTIGGVSGYGTLGLNVKTSGTSITDNYTNPLSGGFTGTTYTIHSAPALTAGGSSATFTEADPYTGNTAVVVDGGMTLSDAGSSVIDGATVTLNNAQTGDTLAFNNTSTATYGNISASYSGGILTLSLASHSATITQWEAALDAVTFDNSAALPNTTARSLTISVTDSNSLASNSLSETVNVTHTAQSPVMTTSGGTTNYVANAAAVIVDGAAVITESDGTQVTSVTITISNNYQSGDVLAWTSTGSTGDVLSSAFDSSTHSITLSSADATISQWDAAMQAVQFVSSAGTGNRTISFVASNSASENSNTGIQTVHVTPPPPTLALGPGNGGFTESDPYTSNTAIVIDSGISLTPGGSTTMTSATVSFAGGTYQSGQDVLSLGSGSYGNIQASFDSSTGTLTLSSSGNTATAAQWQAALDAVSYNDTAASPNTTMRQFSFTITDSTSATSNAISETVSLFHTAQDPAVATSSGSTNYVANSAATTIDGSVAVTESDGTALSSVTVTVGSGAQAGDILSFTNNGSTMGNITGVYDSTTHALTLSSSGNSATLSQWDAALQAVEFSTSSAAGNRTVAFVALNSSSETSNTATKIVDVTPAPPTLALGPGNPGFTESDPYTSNTGVAIDSGISLTPGGSTTFTGATITLTNAKTGDTLDFQNTSSATFGNISGSYSAGVLTLSSVGNTATAADWQAALDAVTFNNAIGQPDTTLRNITVSVTDSNSLSSNVLTESMSVIHTDQSPIVTATSGSASYTVGGSAITLDSSLSVSEADSTALSSVTLTISSGAQTGDVLNFIANAGTMGNIGGVFSGTTLTLTSAGNSATITQWNAALDAVQFSATVGSGSRTVSIVATNSDAETSNTATRTIVANTPPPPPVTPIVESVTVPAAAIYTAGETLNFTVNFNETVDVSAGSEVPRLSFTLNDGQTVYANYVSGSGTSSLTFSYVVGQGAMETTGLALSNTIDNQNSTIVGTANNAANLTLNDIGDGSHVFIDGTSPSVASINVYGESITNTSSVNYTVTFNEPVTGVNIGDFTLTATGSLGGTIASVVPVSTTSNNGSVYTVTIDNISGQGTLRLDLNPSSGVADLAGTLVPGFASGQIYTIDRIDSAVANVQVPAPGDYTSGQTLNFDVNFNQAVMVNTSNGVPSITLTLASGETVQAQYVSGSGSDTLVFSYTIGANDRAPNGIGVASSITANGASLIGADGNPAVLSLANVGTTSGIDIGSTDTGGSGSGSTGNGGTGGSGTGNGGSTGGSTGSGGTSGSSGNGSSGNTGSGNGNSGGTSNIGTGLPSLPGTGSVQAPVVNPFVWVIPTSSPSPVGGHNSESSVPETFPATTQDTWASAPLISAGQNNQGSADAVGSSTFSGNTPSPINQIVNPAPVDMPALGGGAADHTDILNWQALQDIEQPLTDNNNLGVVDMHLDGNPFAPRTTHAADVLLAQWLGRPHHEAAAALPDAADAQQPIHQAGKISLNQQFSRYGKQAREQDKAALMNHAQHVAQRRGG